MKTCPNCKSSVDDNFDLCWNCQYSFIENRILEKSEFSEVCPQCNTEVDASMEFCPNCNYALAIKSSREWGNQGGERNIDCLRCLIPMQFKGRSDFHEGPLFGINNVLNEIFTRSEFYDLYFCPHCGKVEMFIPLEKMPEEE